jgi:uncharacterized protein YecE (DUF72 family)
VDEVGLARAGLEVLGKRGLLGAVLIQFPWSFRNDAKSREWLRDVVAPFEDLPLVLEVRHASWNTVELYGWLSERGIGFVNIDQPRFKRSIAPSQVVTAPTAYVRVHGRNYRDWFREKATSAERYDYLYSASELTPWAKRVQEIAADSRTAETYVVTNNHYEGKAAANALMLRALVEGGRVAAPEPLLERYGQILSPYV